MKKLNLFLKKSTYSILLICYLFVSGCATNNNFSSKENNAYVKEARIFLERAEVEQNDINLKNANLINAAYLFSKAKNSDLAEKILMQIKQSPSMLDDENNKIKLTKANIHLLRNNPQKAIKVMNTMWVKSAPYEIKKDYHETKSKAYYKQGYIILAAEELVSLNRLELHQYEREDNNTKIMKYLHQLTPSQLLSLERSNNMSSELRGWLTFSYLNKNYDADQNQTVRELNQWRQKYKSHAANKLVPEAQNNGYILYQPKIPHQIALLLPITNSPYSESALAIRNGFIAATYSFYKNNGHTPKIKIYDTGITPVVDAYNEAIDAGSDFIVGPLIKENVKKLKSKGSFNIPVLALNNISNGYYSSRKNFFEFGLSPENEARIVAEKAMLDGHKKALIIAPKNEWGSRVANSFSQNWNAVGGRITDTVLFDSTKNLDRKIQHLLGIDKSKQRAKNLRNIGIKVNYTPRRRQDVDFIFIASKPAMARQIKPLLNFHYAGKLPVYATSSIYSGNNTKRLNQDLNGIMFCDVPWILDKTIKSKKIHKDIMKKWPKEYKKSPRLFALGIDAYKISRQLDQLVNFQEMGISGMTGILKLNDDNTINRELIWAKFKNGEAKLVAN